jgi:uncharacterized membrane protein YsdA (DUF1294 family)
MAQRRQPNPPRQSQRPAPRRQIDARAPQRSGARSSRGIAQRLAWRFNRRSPYAQFTLIAAAFSLLLALILVVYGVDWYIAWLIGWSIVTFCFYGLDKRSSKQGRPDNRVPEEVLHVLALIGGFPGGWLGRAYWRHKTLHPSFLIILIVSTILHIGIAFWRFGTPI